MSELFTCPQCGGHCYGRDVVPDDTGVPQVMPTVRCHCDVSGASLSSPGAGRPCGWSGDWTAACPHNWCAGYCDLCGAVKPAQSGEG